MSDPDAVREVTGRWLRAATDDLRAAQLLAESDEITPDVACFHAQQAAEKALKSVLVATRSEVPRSHDLDMLHGIVVDVTDASDLRLLADDMGWLTEVGLGGRYPDGSREEAAAPEGGTPKTTPVRAVRHDHETRPSIQETIDPFALGEDLGAVPDGRRAEAQVALPAA